MSDETAPQPVLSVGALIAGIVLMLVGNWYQVAVPSSAVWTDQQAEEFQTASARFHSASFGHGHSHDKSHVHSHDKEDVTKSPEYIEAKAAFEKVQADLDRNRNRQIWTKYAIIGLGVLVAGSGVISVALGKLKDWNAPTRQGKHGKGVKHGSSSSHKFHHP